MKDLLLDKDGDLLIQNGDIAVGESLTQDVSIIIRLSKGDLKSDPVLGADLITMINQKESPAVIEDQIRLHLERDGKDYDQIKEQVISNSKKL
ncbi:conserved hypothetical protein [Tenacibaculum maritimum]|uniref:hypothetical protein n=1 Tax=Tenacibaculum maritimum TaxID=107401 RepID=UPI0012E5E1F5|nr:hypothetical protein [Tenacibaculum maritimum]CAA0228449.1 conserved hypothetical protein [Tenacibaculum maritimum]CAA0249356.1 conserved hypothetical protein [Tenacibaculum maritimum]